MKKLILAVAFIAVFGLTTVAYAVPVYTLTQADLLGLSQLGATPAVSSLFGSFAGSGGVVYTGFIGPSTTQWRELMIGDSTPPVTDLSGYSHYALFFDNTDNNDTFSVSLFMYANSTTYTSPWIELTNGADATLNWDISGITRNNVGQIGFNVAYNGNTPLSQGSSTYQGDAFNILVTPTPEPSSMLLLGMGVLGLFRLGKRKKA